MPIPVPDVAIAAARLGRRLSVPAEATGWAPPPLPDLIARIDAALRARHAAQ